MPTRAKEPGAIPAPVDPGCKARVVGPLAARALVAGALGRVSACFEQSFYVELGTGCLCLGGVCLGPGPLTLLCEGLPEGVMRARLNVGDVAHVEPETLFAGQLRIDFAEAAPWWPAAVGAWDQASLGRGVAAANAALRTLKPHDGLALLAPRGVSQRQPIARAAAAPRDYLAQLLSAGPAAEQAAPDAARIAPLIGLGPGLTPSGDDFLGGLLVALALVGRVGLRDRLWQALGGAIAERTTDISRAHLAAAAEGLAGAALHGALNAILTGASADIEAACAALGRVGHTSGWDALTGALLVLETTARPRAEPGGTVSASARRPRSGSALRFAAGNALAGPTV
jgi:uncharacterized protein DUF2877